MVLIKKIFSLVLLYIGYVYLLTIPLLIESDLGYMYVSLLWASIFLFLGGYSWRYLIRTYPFKKPEYRPKYQNIVLISVGIILVIIGLYSIFPILTGIDRGLTIGHLIQMAMNGVAVTYIGYNVFRLGKRTNSLH